jgi:hypothetical protein
VKQLNLLCKFFSAHDYILKTALLYISGKFHILAHLIISMHAFRTYYDVYGFQTYYDVEYGNTTLQ